LIEFRYNPGISMRPWESNTPGRRLQEWSNPMYDTIIIGGGPAGLAGAVHLAWHNRSVLVIDRRTGPLFFTVEKLFNVPGMPEIRGTDLMKNLQEHAKSLGAELLRGNVVNVEGEEGNFTVHTAKDESFQAKTLLLSTGVARHHPTVDGDHQPCFKYAGKGNLFYCPDCEAPEIQDKETIVIGVGAANGAAGMALGLSRYTDRLSVLLTGGTDLSDERTTSLSEKGIDVTVGELADLIGKPGALRTLVLKDGTELNAEAFFVSSPTIGRVDLLEQLGVELTETGNHAQLKSQRGDTNVPGVWVAGDIRPMSQQVAVSMGTGNIAALMIDQHLRKQDIA
jgi:thioredoxin reductase